MTTEENDSVNIAQKDKSQNRIDTRTIEGKDAFNVAQKIRRNIRKIV